MELKKKYLAIPLVAIALLAVGAYGTGILDGTNIKFISGTEYQVGEEGQVIVRVVDAYGNGVTATWCNVTIYNPSKVAIETNVAMIQGGASGSWYHNFTASTDIGVYEEQVFCKVTSPNKTIGAGSSFHIQQTLTMLNETSSAQVRVLS